MRALLVCEASINLAANVAENEVRCLKLYLVDCSGLLHQKPKDTNLEQYPLVASRVSSIPKKG